MGALASNIDLAQQREAEVRAALAQVRDPEIDETVAELDFILGVAIEGGRVSVELKLPTFWCPANFVWLMAEDMRQAVLALPWATDFALRLVDHFAESEISEGVTRGRRFEEVFPSRDGRGLDDLKRDFAGRIMLIRQGPLLAALQRAGFATETILAWDVAQITGSTDGTAMAALWEGVRERRAAAGLSLAPDAPGLCDAQGQRPRDLESHRREIRLAATNAAANGEMCRMLVQARREGGGATHGCGAFAPRHAPDLALPNNRSAAH